MDRDILTILQRDNPWLGDPSRLQEWLRGKLPAGFIQRRSVSASTHRWNEPDRAHLVIGPRQAGKTTAIWSHLAAQGKEVLFVDCEQSLAREWCASAPLFLADLERLAPAPPALFFDEIQHLDEAGLFLKGLVDRGIGAPILATGSSSYHLGARTRESLAGRATRDRLLPLSLAEVSADLSTSPPLIGEERLRERWRRHVVFGGFPAVWLSDSPAPMLAELVNAVVIRDASDFFRVTRPDAFRRLLRLAAGQVGSLVNVSEWSSVLGLTRAATASYLEILEENQVVASIAPYAGGKRVELTSRPKLYFVDNGIRNQLAQALRPWEEIAADGPPLENWVFSELWKRRGEETAVHFWRSTSGTEVDFVIDAPGALVGVEVKAGALGRAKLPRGCRGFIEAYAPKLFLVVNTGIEAEESVGDTRVVWTLPWRLDRCLDTALGAG